MKKAICVGINNYPGTANDLNGCINDANDWSKLLESFEFETTKILDDQATKSNILNALKNLVSGASAGDVVVFTYSGHGTQVMDTNGDEADGYDEALYVYDGPLVDDDLRTILDSANKEAQIVIITDSCFSGTVTKALAIDTAKRRFIKTDIIPAGTPLKKPFLTKAADENMVEILLSGCSDKEYSYDAYINNKWNGAMTANAISLIQKGQTYNEFYTKLRKKLPSADYPQTPQLEGSEPNKNNKIFTAKTGTGTDTGGTNTGGSTGSWKPGCLLNLLTLIAISAGMVFLLLRIF